MKRFRADHLFFLVYGAFVATAAVWLVVGLVPAIAGSWGDLHRGLHDLGEGLSGAARNAAHAAHAERSAFQVILDYLFSILNFALGLIVIRLRPQHASARLLSIGLIGSAVAFNLQGHDALQIVPFAWLPAVSLWHDWLHVISGFSYVFALLLFPDGHLGEVGPAWRVARPIVLFFAFPVLVGMTISSIDDHTLGLVLLFGIAIPVVGLFSQIGRYHHAGNADVRQRSRVLVLVLTFALAGAALLMFITDATAAASEGRTVSYEVTGIPEGLYYFRCDPHPDDMIGTARLAPGEPAQVSISAESSEFSSSTISLASDTTSRIDFTNLDPDLHNVALYRDPDFSEPVFIGTEFSGEVTAITAFRIFRILFTVIPLALFAGLVRTRLWEINRVLNRALLYGGVVGVITAIYLGAVVGLGALFGTGRRVDLFVSVIVTLLVAALFQPLRDAARRVANRLVYGERVSPYDVVSDLSRRVAATHEIDEVIPALAEAVGGGTGAVRVDVWLRVGGSLVLTTSWPRSAGIDEERTHTVSVKYDLLPDLPNADIAVPVMDAGELLGAITIVKPTSDPATEEDRVLLDGVASQAGLVLRNAKLAAELRHRLDELKASRQRIVAAQDDERRRIERDLHDGAQQQLVAIAAKLQLARRLADKDSDAARTLLDELEGDTLDAMGTLRDLARGIYPPVLADKGVVAALEAHARRSPVEVRVSGNGKLRFSPEAENAIFFCCLEAIQNATKHGAPPIEVDITSSAEGVAFSIKDRGKGIDPSTAHGTGLDNMRDRITVLGGMLTVQSSAAGTHVSGHIPQVSAENAPGKA